MQRNKPHYRVTLGDVISAHEQALTFGPKKGLGIRDLNLIESAIGRPYTGYYRSIHRKAAALVHSLAANHGFVDGNKRTALLTLHILLDRSGYELTATDDDALQQDIEKVITDIVTHDMTFTELVTWMKERIRRK